MNARQTHFVDQAQAGVRDLLSLVEQKMADLEENRLLWDAHYRAKTPRDYLRTRKAAKLSDEKCGL